MLRIFQSESVNAAIKYFSSLAKGDYFFRNNSQEMSLDFGGKLAEELGIFDQPITKEIFEKLCRNRRPDGSKLTCQDASKPIAGYDFNFGPPKSVSIMYELTKDQRIFDAFVDSVRKTMAEVEKYAEGRIRVDKQYKNRTTGNILYSLYVHRTTRPVDGLINPIWAPINGMPDPHLHAHAYLHNCTYDAVEDKMKAIQIYNVKHGGDVIFYEAYFHNLLVQKMQELGYQIRYTAKGWEVAGVSEAVIQKFSRRTHEIEKYNREMGITDSDLKAETGRKTARAKATHLSMDELHEAYKEVLDDQEWHQLQQTCQEALQNENPILNLDHETTLNRAVDYAMEHCFNRRSVRLEKQVIAEILKYSIGTLTPDAIRQELKRRGVLFSSIDNRVRITTNEALWAEEVMKDFARAGRNACDPLHRGEYIPQGPLFENPEIDTREQESAIEHILSSRDRVIAIRGPAGAGKTTLMNSAIKGIVDGVEHQLGQSNRNVFVFAPTGEASRNVLRSKGFNDADTVHQLLENNDWHKRIENQVVWIDEAGMLSIPDMNRIFELSKQKNFRVILSGDDRQNSSVEWGDAFRVLIKSKSVDTYEMTQILRQQENPDYLEAVEYLSKGTKEDAEKGFNKLVEMGAVIELPRDELAYEAAYSYVSKISEKENGHYKNAVLTCPTHAGGKEVTDIARAMLRDSGRLDLNQKSFPRLQRLDLTPAQRKEARHYETGQVIEFHTAGGGFKAGERTSITHVDLENNKVRLSKNNAYVPFELSENFSVFEGQDIQFAKDDRLRITKGGTFKDALTGKRHRIETSSDYNIKDFDKKGNIALDNGWTLPKTFGHWTHGRCLTSQGSQSRDEHSAVGFYPSDSICATNMEAFYVSTSRGRESVVIYTDDIQALGKAVEQSAERISSSEMVKESNPAHLRMVQASVRLERYKETVQRQYEYLKTYTQKQLSKAYTEAKEVINNNLPDLSHRHYRDFDPPEPEMDFEIEY